REPAGLDAFLGECELARGGDRRLDRHLDAVATRARSIRDGSLAPGVAEFEARRLVEELALALQGALLVRHAPSAVADAFCASRIGGGAGRAYGTLPAGVDAIAVIDRALPAPA